MPTAAAISAVGSLGSAAIGAYGSSRAANAQAQAQQAAIAAQMAMFQQAQKALSPYISAGAGVLPTLEGLLTPGQDQTKLLSQLPGFQFMSNYGTMAATNALAARGLGGAPGPLSKAVSDYNTGLAGTQFFNLINALQGFAGMGAGAGSALAGNATATGANLGQSYAGLGQANAAGILGGANALSSGLSGLGNAAMLYSLGQRFGGPATGIYGGGT